jgi:hypothetical protein
MFYFSSHTVSIWQTSSSTNTQAAFIRSFSFADRYDNGMVENLKQQLCPPHARQRDTSCAETCEETVGLLGGCDKPETRVGQFTVS